MKVGANSIDFIALLAAPVVAVMVFYGGFLVMTTGSQPTRATKGWSVIKSGALGAIITLGAWIIVNTLLGFLSGSGLGSIQCPSGELIERVAYEPTNAYREQSEAPRGNYSQTVDPIRGALPISASVVRRFNNTLHGEPGSGHGWASCGNPLCAVDLNVGNNADEAYNAARAGIPIYSPIAGIVKSIGTLPSGTGLCVRIVNAQQNNFAVLCHVSVENPSSLLQQQVRPGQQIGTLTAFRGTFGPHLHFELMIRGTWIIGTNGRGDVWSNQMRALGG
jgi:hypothetical protein